MRRNLRLHFDSLEDRQVPATFGIPWADSMHLTVSFAPDGTDIDGTASNLFQAMQRVDPTGAWRRDVLRAIQAWSNVTNINVGVTADSGEALGTTAPMDGSANFGTIRIAAKPLP